MLNTALFRPRNFIVITAFAILSHIVARPLYTMIDKKEAE